MKTLPKIALAVLLSMTSIWAEKIALIVGVPAHFQGSVGQGINIDIANMTNLFSSYGFKVDKLIDESATTGMLRKKLNQYQRMSSDDTFVFCYTGHGAQMPDSNGDENDGKDEVIVLHDHPMDGSSKGFFVDDEMYSLLTKIPAQKFVFFDSCHSGSAFKSISGKAVPKSLGYFSKAMTVREFKEPSAREKRSILFFGAARDHQESIATPSGSMFTLALMDGMKRSKADTNGDGKTTFDELLRFSIPDIKRQVQNCPSNWGCKMFSPEMHGQEDILSKDIRIAMNVKNENYEDSSYTESESFSEVELDLDSIMNDGETKQMTLHTHKSYMDGDNIELKFNSGSYRGYLTIITIDSDDITVLYPNKFQPDDEQYQGSVNFPSDITNKFGLTAMEPYGRTVSYAILSDAPLGLYEKGGKALFKVLPRGGMAAKNLLRGIGVKEYDTMMIGKAVFTVKRGN